MSLGSRTAQRCKAAVLVSSGLISTPREPPFLHHCVRNLATKAAIASSDDGKAELSMPHGLWKASLQSAQDRSHRDQRSSSAVSPPSINQSPSVSLDDREILTELQRNLNLATVRDKLPTTRPVNPTVRRVIQKAEQRERRKQYDRQVRQQYFEETRQFNDNFLPNWRTILEKLELHTPQQSEKWHDNALKIVIPEKAVGQLLFGIDNSIWDIKQQCGCQIELLPSAQQDSTLLLSGPVTSLAKAAAQILQIAASATKATEIRVSDHLNFKTWAPNQRSYPPANVETSQVVPRFVRANQRSSIAIPQRADSLSKPTTWTQSSFALYIRQLTHMKMSAHLQKSLYSRPGQHREVVMQTLRDAFVDPECQGVISTSAVNDALQYFQKHSRVPDVRTLFVIMEMRKVPLSTESFNIMLRGAAKIQDLHTFSFILGLMLRRCYTPDSGTWLAFLMALENYSIKQIVLESMTTKGLFHERGLWKLVCNHFVTHEIEAALDAKLDLPQFVEHMGIKYGKDWLSVSVANRILDALGNRGLIVRCVELIDLMSVANITPDIISLDTILQHCRQQNDMEAAVDIVQRIYSITDLKLTARTYGILFEMAWKSNSNCVAQIVWRYACLNAETSYRMRRRVSESAKAFMMMIIGYPSPGPTDDDLKSASTIRPFVGGLKCPSVSPLVNSPRLLEVSSDVQELPEWEKADEPGFKERLEQLWKLNIDMYREWRPTRPFPELFAEAVAVDKDLMKNGQKGLNWLDYLNELKQRAPRVDLLPRVGKHGGVRSWEECVNLSQRKLLGKSLAAVKGRSQRKRQQLESGHDKAAKNPRADAEQYRKVATQM